MPYKIPVIRSLPGSHDGGGCMANTGKGAMPKPKGGSLPETVKDRRAKVALTQEQFAARAGVTFSTVNR